MNIQKSIIEESRSWIGTKFHHQGRVKKSSVSLGGCDCLGLVMGVAKTLELKDMHGVNIADLDEKNYPPSPDGKYLYRKLTQHFNEKDISDIAAGDIALFSFVKNPQHLAFIGEICYGASNHYTLIHSYSVNGFVCEHILDTKWLNRLVAVFRLF